MGSLSPRQSSSWRVAHPKFFGILTISQRGCPILSAFCAERVGYLEPRPSVFHTTANLRPNSLQKITHRSCLLVKKMGGEGATCRQAPSAIFQPTLPFN